MSEKLKVITVEENIDALRQVSEEVPIEQINTPEFHKFLDDMKIAAKESDLMPGWVPAGLAAIQVGKPIAVFICIDVYTDEFKEYINPKIKVVGDKTVVDLEGCLSIPKSTGYVERPKKIQITYYDRFAKKHKEKLTGFNARIVQHENDHLYGILFTDKLVKNAN